MRFAAALVACSLLGAPLPVEAAMPTAKTAHPIEKLSEGATLHGFKVVSRYRGSANTPLGARLVHVKSGFTLDLLQIQSVPQAHLWVDSWPTSDQGEPHTQEHLLLGKGNRGRAVATLDSMSLTETSAYTEQRRTAYHLATSAGPDVFYGLLEARLDALLHPNYSDEEIRREVRNFGVTEGEGGSLRLEEQGTVYNEMSSTYERPWSRLYRQLSIELYGPKHPLSYDAGGTPEALRTLTPEDIRRFHDANYHLAQMGMIASLPKDMALAPTLKRLDALLNRVEPGAQAFISRVKHDEDLPKWQASAPGSTRIIGYPDTNAAAPGQVMVAWPAKDLFGSGQEHLLAGLFASSIGGDATTNLYKRFIDSKTRRMDLGATGVYAGFSEEPGHSLQVAFSDVAVAHLTPDALAKVRAEIMAELKTIEAWPDGSPELAAFNTRVLALLQDTRRSLAKFVNSPPGFGFRGTYSNWQGHLDQLAKRPGFDKSVTLDAELAALEKLLKGKVNPWRSRLAAWGLTTTQPITIAVKPDPALLTGERTARDARLAAETTRLKAQYKTTDTQEALRRYRVDFDATTAALKRAEAASAAQRFLEKPPLGRDTNLDFRTVKLAHQVPLVASTFDTMTGATTGLALKLDGLSPDQLVFLGQLPALLTQVGIVENGKPVAHEEVTRRLRTEILGVQAYYDRNPRTRRCELVVRGAGNTPQEAERAIAWMQRMALAPDWRKENLPRLRDVVGQAVGSLRQTSKGAEEHWVRDPASAFRFQDDPLQLATGSFLTVEHNSHRLSWLLRDAGPAADRKALTSFFDALSAAKGSRAELQKLTAVLAGEATGDRTVATALAPSLKAFDALSPAARTHAVAAAQDLTHYMAELPENSLAADWRYLATQMRDDLLVSPETTLAALNGLRRQVLSVHRARMFMIGAKPLQDTLLKQPVPALLAQLSDDKAPGVTASRATHISDRLREREPGAKPVFVGLVAPNTQSGVFVNSAPLATYRDTDREALLRFLSSKLYGGGGAHSIFMKTWGAGLAYSNGLQGSAASGEIVYYAERCPELPQTLGFVIGELKAAQSDPALVEYAYALAFDDSRAAGAYESRGEAMASDLADGWTPAVVKTFREALLALRAEKGLTEALFTRMPKTYGAVLPGLEKKGGAVPGATYFVIGPDTQLVAYERYLKATEGLGQPLYRLYPRDFWQTAPANRLGER